MKNNIYFITFVDDNIQEDRVKFKDEVISILTDDNGWKKYDYNFICINDWVMDTSLNNIIYKTIKATAGGIAATDESIDNQIKTSKYPILKIYLKSAKQTNKDCEMHGFSCTRFKDNYIPIDIIINYNNWCGKSKSSLAISDYRKYVINHEVGHWLGLDHTECPIDQCKKMGLKECPASIMQQMTRGPKYIWPCKEQPYPLDHIFNIDNPKISKYRFISHSVKGGSGKKKKYLYLIILIIIILLFFIIIYYIILYKKFKK
jgi:hypothetical protein